MVAVTNQRKQRNNMASIDDLSGFDKAAVLYGILGEPLALTLFSNITEAETLKLRVRAQELQHTPLFIKKQILEEYYFNMMTKQYHDKDSPNKLFEFLENLNDEQLYYLLANEAPKVIALAIEQLDDNKKMTLLNKLPNDVKNKVIISCGNLDDIPLEAIVNIAQEIEKKTAFIPGPKEFSRGGGQSVAKILSSMNEDDAKQYMEQIKQDDPKLFAKVKQHFISYEDVMNLPEAMATDMWSNPDIDLDQLAKALKGTEQEEVDKILDYMPGKRQAMYTPIDGPMAKRDVDDARLYLLNIARDKISSGEWNIDDLLGGGEVIE